MIPIALDPSRVDMALAGRGERAVKRLAQLREAGAASLAVYAPEADNALAVAAGDAFSRGLPDDEALSRVHVLWIVDLPAADSARLAERARALRVLVNVEDVTGACDFHNVAQVRRGDLLLTVSTGGRSPAVASHVRRVLGEAFGDDWAKRLDAIGEARTRARDAGANGAEVRRITEALLAADVRP